MSEDHNGDYEVGFGKPPSHSRFKPGQSGNPSGRKHGSKNLATIVRKAVNERVKVSENGRRHSMTKLDAAVKQLVNKAASGDQKANQLLLALVQVIEGRAEVTASAAAPLTDLERELIADMHERYSHGADGGKDE